VFVAGSQDWILAFHGNRVFTTEAQRSQSGTEEAMVFKIKTASSVTPLYSLCLCGEYQVALKRA